MKCQVREMTDQERSAKQAWRGRSLSDRQAHMPSILVMHPQFSHSVSEIQRRVNRVVAQKKGAALYVIAETGGGKTTLADVIQTLYPDSETYEISVRRTIKFTVPPRASSATMSSAALRALGDPRWNKGRTDVTLERLTHLLKECKTEIVLIDNVHDIPERRKRKGVREVGNWIRDLIDEVPALFVTLGAKQGLEVVKSNGQARRRNPANIRIDYFDCNAKGGVARLRRLLHEIDIQLPLAELCDLGEFETMRRIWVATHGILDYIIKLMTEAMEVTIENHREVILYEDLSKGYRRLFEDGCSPLNPFDKKITDLRLLDKEGEPFAGWLDDGFE